MSTLQYKFIRTSTLLFMGLKTRCKQSEYCTWWGVPSVNMKYMPLPMLYCDTVMEALLNAGQLPALQIVSNGPIVCSV